MTRVREVAGRTAAVCVVGDTPADVQAAHANGLEVIAVATGIFSKAALEAEAPERCVASLQGAVAERKSPAELTRGPV